VQVKSILEVKKINNTSIVLNSFQKDIEQISDILSKCQDTLSPEQLTKMISILPNDEEKKLLQDYNEDWTKVSNAERLLKALIDIPRVKQRLEYMMFKKNYDMDFDDYTEKILDLNYPFTRLKVQKKLLLKKL
jgi:hypothetical protein